MARTSWTRWRPARLFLLAAVLSLAASWAGAVVFVPFTPRYNHSATALPDRNTLLCGGSISSAGAALNDSGVITKGCQLFMEGAGQYADTGSMTEFRSSHTATLLPNGKVLITGGHDGVSFHNTAELYDPVAGTFGGNLPSVMSAGRRDHTATLLENGTVLICGGQNAAATVTDFCDIFNPATNVFTPTAVMPAPRSAHTATLLRDGRVFIAGGYNMNVTPKYLVTTAIYNPGSGSFASAHSLIAARAFHSATMMGSGKVFIAGGFNTKDVLANKGFLDSTEIYDPVADSMVPAAQMKVRRLGHTATLDASGKVDVYGGLGNLTTTYITNFTSPPFANGVKANGTFAPTNILSTMNVTGITAPMVIENYLNVDVTGIPENADIFLSCPTIILPEAAIYLKPGNQENLNEGMRLSFNGTAVGCDNAGRCGYFNRSFAFPGAGNFTGSKGSIFKMTGLGVTSFTLGGANLTLSGALDNNNPIRDITAGTVSSVGNVRVTGFSSRFDGASFSGNGTFTVGAGAWVQVSSYAVVLDGGSFVIPSGTTIGPDGLGGYRTSLFALSVTGVTGTITYGGTDTSGQTFGPALVIPDVVASPVVDGVSGSLEMVPTQIDLGGGVLRADVATIVVRAMMFSGMESYRPNVPTNPILSNTWEYGERVSHRSYNHTAIRSPSGELRIHGGRACSGAPGQINVACNRVEASTRTAYLPIPVSWTTLPPTGDLLYGQRGNHTATTLPDGKILVAGGTSGPNILGTAELFDPTNEQFTQVGSMHVVRDLHSATLLPNGRVLAAGGFSTSATSSGATKTADLYYPETRVWLPTEPMIASHSLHTATLLPDGNVLVAGGLANGVYENRAEIFYSTAGTWHQTSSMGTRRAQHSATLLKSGKVLVVGGLNASGVLGSAELYDPATGLWTATAFDLVGGAHSHSHSASLMFDGRVMVAGGNDEFGEVSQSQLYDPAADAFTTTQSLGGNAPNPRFNHASNILPNGAVFISGGAKSNGEMVKQAETFNIAYSTWTSGGDFVTPRGFHTMTLAKNGFLYAIGGYDGINYLKTVERLYFTTFPDFNTTAAPPSTRISSITLTDRSVFDRNELLNVTGTNFHGATEGSGGGSGSMNSSHMSPTMLLEAVGGSGGTGSQGNSGFVLDLAQRIFVSTANWAVSNTSVTVLLPAGPALPYGWYHLRMGANAQYSDSLLVQAGPAKPTLPVTALTAVTLSTSDVRWNWTAAGGAFDGYNVYSATDGVFITSLTAASVSFIQRRLTPNTSAQILIAPYKLTGDGPLLQSATTFPFANIPAGFSISSVTAEQIRLDWSANLNRDGTVYEISQSTDGFTTAITTPVPRGLNLQTTFFIVTPLADNTTYYFRIRAYNGNDVETAFSGIISTRTRSSVAGVVGTPLTTYSIQWSWLDPGGVNSYRVYNSTTGVLLGSPSTNVFVDSALSTNSIRSVTVRAVTGAGDGPLSESATAYTLAAVPVPATPDVVNVTTGSFKVNWLANDNPPGTLFTVEIATALAFGQILASVQTVGVIAGFGDLTPPSDVYGIRVSAANGDGVISGPVVFGSTPTLSNTPSLLTVTGTTPSSIDVAWNSSNNGSSTTYQVTFSTDNFATNIATAVPFSLGFSGTVATIGGLLTSTTYGIRVVARNSVGRETAFSNIITTITSSGGAVLGSLGGTLSAASNSVITGSIGSVPPRLVTLQAPVGAFSSDVGITISSVNVTVNALCGAGASPLLGISVTASPALQPNKPVYLTISYTAAEQGALPSDRLVLLRHEPSLGKCVPVQTTVDPVNRTLTAALNHFSVFQMAAVTPAANSDGARVFPNPWYASRVGQVTFHRLPAAARVRIFTLKGELVLDHRATATGMFTWGGLNRGGRRIASGVYLVVIEGDSGPRKILKLAVLQ